jgi:hypothetical protein
MRARSFAALALALALPVSVSITPAVAQSAAAPAPTATTAPASDVRSACKADLDRLCPGVERGEARRACVDTNKDKFSDGCKAARSAARDANQDSREAFRAACAGDIAKLCANVEKGQGRTTDCVRANSDKVVAACKTALDGLPAGGQRAEAAKGAAQK